MDTDGDGVLSEEEAAAQKALDLTGKGVSSLDGIETFTGLTGLDCQDSGLSKVDLSNNTALEQVNLSGNNLTQLNISRNTELKRLEVSDNKLKKLDISRNGQLTYLDVSGNSLTQLDVSNNPALANCVAYGDKSEVDGVVTYSDANTTLIANKGVEITGVPQIRPVTSVSIFFNGVEAENAENVINDDPVTISWSADGDVASYIYTVTDANDGVVAYGNASDATSYVVEANAIAPDLVYKLRVGAKPLKGTDSDIVWKTVKFKRQSVPIVGLITALALKLGGENLEDGANVTLSNGDAIFSWEAEGDLEAYSYSILDGNKAPVASDSGAAVTGCTVEADDVTAGEVYTLKVIAIPVNGTEADGISVTVYFKREPAPVEGLAINEDNFPDAAFRSCLAVFDTDRDGVLTEAETEEIGFIAVSGKGVSSLEGIEFLPKIYGLDCSDNNLEALDLCGNKELVLLYCQGNPLTALDVSDIPVLEDCVLNGGTEVSEGVAFYRLGEAVLSIDANVTLTPYRDPYATVYASPAFLDVPTVTGGEYEGDTYTISFTTTAQADNVVLCYQPGADEVYETDNRFSAQTYGSVDGDMINWNIPYVFSPLPNPVRTVTLRCYNAEGTEYDQQESLSFTCKVNPAFKTTPVVSGGEYEGDDNTIAFETTTSVLRAVICYVNGAGECLEQASFDAADYSVRSAKTLEWSIPYAFMSTGTDPRVVTMRCYDERGQYDQKDSEQFYCRPYPRFFGTPVVTGGEYEGSDCQVSFNTSTAVDRVVICWKDSNGNIYEKLPAYSASSYSQLKNHRWAWNIPYSFMATTVDTRTVWLRCYDSQGNFRQIESEPFKCRPLPIFYDQVIVTGGEYEGDTYTMTFMTNYVVDHVVMCTWTKENTIAEKEEDTFLATDYGTATADGQRIWWSIPYQFKAIREVNRVALLHAYDAGGHYVEITSETFTCKSANAATHVDPANIVIGGVAAGEEPVVLSAPAVISWSAQGDVAGYSYSVEDSRGRVIVTEDAAQTTSWTMTVEAIAAGETYTIKVGAVPANGAGKATVWASAQFICNYVSGDFIMANGVVTGYTGRGGDIVIPSVDSQGKAITEIAAEAFKGTSNITGVYIPDGVTIIGESAFEGCAGLVSVSMPAGVRKIGQSAFDGCDSLRSVAVIR